MCPLDRHHRHSSNTQHAVHDLPRVEEPAVTRTSASHVPCRPRHEQHRSPPGRPVAACAARTLCSLSLTHTHTPDPRCRTAGPDPAHTRRLCTSALPLQPQRHESQQLRGLQRVLLRCCNLWLTPPREASQCSISAEVPPTAPQTHSRTRPRRCHCLRLEHQYR